MKWNLRNTKRIKNIQGEVLALKGENFAWTKPGNRPYIFEAILDANQSFSFHSTIGDFQAKVYNGATLLGTYNLSGDQTIPTPNAAGTYIFHIRSSGTSPLTYIRHDGFIDINRINIKQWGDITWSSMGYMFHKITDLQITAQDIPNLSNVTDMSYMFFNATYFNSYIGNWDVSNVNNMNFMFYYASNFNQNIGGWNTSNAIEMNGMFGMTLKFNQNLSSWCVTNISTKPTSFDIFANAWTLPRPIWGTCP